tara:strand:- start:2920 stop:3288 length:369 start_codon:yes stop_codon:yes gene_type:complete
MEDEYIDPRGYGTQILDYLTAGTSPSEFRGAHETIDRLISNADANTEYAKLFDIDYGTDKMAYFRHLNPSDSTVTILTGLINALAPSMKSDNERLLMDAMRTKDNPTTAVQAARTLAELRNR